MSLDFAFAIDLPLDKRWWEFLHFYVNNIFFFFVFLPFSLLCNSPFLSFHFMQIKYLISIFWPLIMHNKCPIKLFYWHEICSKRFNSLRNHWKLVSLQIFDVRSHSHSHAHSRSIPRGNIHKILNAFVHRPSASNWMLGVFFSPFFTPSIFITSINSAI